MYSLNKYPVGTFRVLPENSSLLFILEKLCSSKHGKKTWYQIGKYWNQEQALNEIKKRQNLEERLEKHRKTPPLYILPGQSSKEEPDWPGQ